MANQHSRIAFKILRTLVIACCVALIGLLGSALTQSAIAQPTNNGQPSYTDDDIFSEIETGVRLLGKPSPSATLGQILKFSVVSENQLIAVCPDGVKLWDIEKRKIAKSHQFDEAITNCIAMEWTSDKELFAISTWSYQNTDPHQAGRVLIFDRNLDLKNDLTFVETDEETEPQISNQIMSVEFAPGDEAIAVANASKLRLLDLGSEDVIQEFSMGIDPARPSRLVFHDDKIHALGGNSKSFDLETGKVSILKAPFSSVSGFYFSAYARESNRLFASMKNELTAINLADGKTQSIDSIVESTHLFELSLSPDESLLAVTHLNDSAVWLSIIDTKDLSLKYQFENLPQRPTGVRWGKSNEAIYVAFNMSAGFQKFKIDASEVQQKPKYALNLPLQSVTLPFDGSRIVSTNMTRVVSRDWTTGAPTNLGSYNHIYPTKTKDGFFAMNQKGQTLSLVKQRFDRKKTQTVASYSMRRQVALPLTAFLFGASDQPTSEPYFVVPSSISVNEPKKQVHCVVLDGLAGIRIQSFNLADRKRTRDQLFKRPATSMRINPTAITDKGEIFAVAEDGKVKIIEVDSAATLIETDARDVNQMLFAKSGEWIAITKPNGITILETKTGKQLKQIDLPKPLISYASESDELVITSKKAGSPVRIFETDTWQVVFEHKTKTADRVAISTSYDSKRIAFALSNCRVELWDVDEIAK